MIAADEPGPVASEAPPAGPELSLVRARAARMAGVLVLALLGASLLVLGLVVVQRRWRRRRARNLTRYAITYRDRSESPGVPELPTPGAGPRP